MPTQRLLLTAIAGKAGVIVAKLFHHWQGFKQTTMDGSTWPEEIRNAVDALCHALRENVSDLSLAYHCEWVDRWLMGDDVAAGIDIIGRRFMVCCATADEVNAWLQRCPEQHQEHHWLKARLREALTAWQRLAGVVSVVLVREVIGPTATDEEVTVALDSVPPWLAAQG